MLIVIAVLGSGLYAQTELNSYVSAAEQLHFTVGDVGISALSIDWSNLVTPIDATMQFFVNLDVGNPSGRDLLIPPFGVAIHMNGINLGYVSTTQFYVSSGQSHSLTLNVTVNTVQLASYFKHAVLFLASQVWDERSPEAILQVVGQAAGTANLHAACLFLSATVPIPLDVSRTVHLSKP